MDKMRALSVHQPWASLIASGEKRVENRSWKHPTKYRGVLLIHASKKLIGGPRDRNGEIIPLGAIVAVVQLTAILSVKNARQWFKSRGIDQRLHLFGPTCLILDNVFRLPEPVPCKGFQGLWIPHRADILKVTDQMTVRHGLVMAIRNKTEWER